MAPSLPLPRQAEAMALIWAVYNPPADPPGIDWQAGAELDCDPWEGRYYGWTGTATGVGETCLQGRSLLAAGVAQVAIREGDRFSDTALTHELYHFALQARTGDADDWHEGPGWGRYVFVGDEGGYVRGEVDDAQDVLVGAGL